MPSAALPGRNDPCPCGSGKKYKRCCQPKDDRMRANLAVVPGLAGRVAAQTARAGRGRQPVETWEAAIVPIPGTIGDARDTRPATILIVAGAVPIHVNVLERPPAEPAEIAAVIAEAVAAVAREQGVAPRRLRVAHRSVAEALRRLVPEGVRVEARAHPRLDAVAADLLTHLGAERAGSGKVGMASTWRAWGLPDSRIRELFTTAAAFHRAAPWRDLLNEQLLDLETPAGGRWTACVLGNGGNEFGLALYADREDFERQARVNRPSEGFGVLKSPMVSLTFDRQTELPPAMRKEILAAGWEVAGPNAYPTLLTVNTPAGGVTTTQTGDLAAALRAVPRFVAAHRELLRSRSRLDQPVRWRDTGTAVTVVYAGPAGEVLEPIWAPPERLAPSLAAGPGARPEAAFETRDPDEVWHEHERLLELFMTAERRARRAAHLMERDAALARFFLEFLSSSEAIPVAAATEYDLRMFLYDWFSRKVRIPIPEARGLPAALQRFFAFLTTAEGIEFPWADAILADRERFEERLRTFPGGFVWDEAVERWRQQAHADFDARVLFADPMLDDGETWAEEMGMVEYGLHRELHRRWLIWRDEVIRTGTVHPADVRAELVARQRRWLEAPHPGHGGKTPVEAVRAARQIRA